MEYKIGEMKQKIIPRPVAAAIAVAVAVAVDIGRVRQNTAGKNRIGTTDALVVIIPA